MVNLYGQVAANTKQITLLQLTDTLFEKQMKDISESVFFKAIYPEKLFTSLRIFG